MNVQNIQRGESKMSPIEIRRDGQVICVCADESCLYSKEILKDMKDYGYKFY